MGDAAIGRLGRVVDRRADEWVAEFDVRRERDQAARLDPGDRGRPRHLPERLGSSAHERRIARPFGRSQQQHRPRLGVERLHSRGEQSGQPLADRERLRKRLPALELRRGQRGGQVDQRQRVALRRGDDAAGDGAVDVRGRGSPQKFAGLGIGQPAELEPGKPVQAPVVPFSE